MREGDRSTPLSLPLFGMWAAEGANVEQRGGAKRMTDGAGIGRNMGTEHGTGEVEWWKALTSLPSLFKDVARGAQSSERRGLRSVAKAAGLSMLELADEQTVLLSSPFPFACGQGERKLDAKAAAELAMHLTTREGEKRRVRMTR